MSKLLRILEDESLKYLRSIYADKIPYASHVVGLIDNYFLTKRKYSDKKFLEFLVLGDDWKSDGTFLVKFRNYFIFTYTLSETGDSIYELLEKINDLKFGVDLGFFAVRNEHLPPIYKAIEKRQLKVKYAEECWIYCLPKEKALEYTTECPEEVYLSKLDQTHSELIATRWGYDFDGKLSYVSLLLEMNGGYGLFLKCGDRLVSWVVRTFMGGAAIMGTLPEYRKKGYASLVLKALCKEIAEDGINPVGTVAVGNTASQNIVEKLGYQYIKNCTFVLI